jgi:hypothetical protein
MEPIALPTSEGEMPQDLRFELAIVRQVMDRLLRLWDEQGPSLNPVEGRRLASLIFNGARTAAILQYHQQRLPGRGDDQAWLASALAALGERHELEL